MERLALVRRITLAMKTMTLALMVVAIGTASSAWAQFAQFGIQQPDGWELYGPRIVELILTGVLGFAVGAFFSPALKPLRRIIWLVAAVAAVAFTLFGPFPIADTLGWIVKTIAFFVALFFGLRLGLKVVAKAAAARGRPTSFGSAKWATADYLTKAGLFNKAGFMLGEFPANNSRSTLRYAGARHLLSVAPTRSGKGVSSIIPNLLLHEGSALVVDPKGENALITKP